MKLVLSLIASSLLAGSFASASASNIDNGYDARIREENAMRPLWFDDSEYVYLNSPYDWQGRPLNCQKVSTYQGGPKTGLWRTYYICKLPRP